MILLVEDNADDERITVQTLKKHLPRARVCVARDGATAIGCIDGSKPLPDEPAGVSPRFVILDLKLPRASGFEVLRAIRTNDKTRTLPVVIFTSSDEPKDVDASYSLGANTYVQKPTDYQDYLSAIKLVADYWFEVATLPGDAA